MDRTAISRALAKCLAYLACGRLDDASSWAQTLVDALRSAGCRVQ